jgi:hypothetical protein
MVDFDTEDFQRSLDDTIAWYAAQFPKVNDLVP